MRLRVLLVYIGLLAVAPLAAQPALQGLAASTLTCVDRDGDGYGTGPVNAISTTVASGISAGTQTVTPAAMVFASPTANTVLNSNSIQVSSLVGITWGEVVSGSGIPAGSTVTRVLGNINLDGNLLVWLSKPATATASGVSLTFSVGTGMKIRVVDALPQMEYVIVSGVTATTFTAAFLYAHAATPITITDQNCLGPDADDLDSSAHTAAQVITKYGSMTAFLKSPDKAYSPSKYVCLSPTGVDGSGVVSTTSADTACASPFQHWSAIASQVAAGTIVLFRQGYVQDRAAPPSGSSGNPVMLVAYPGEQPTVDPTQSGLSTAAIITQGFSWLVVDGFKGVNGGCISSGGDLNVHSNPHTFHDNIFRHLEGSTCFRGIGVFSGMQNVLLEDSVFHDNGEAGIYWGSGCVPSTNITIRRIISFSEAFSGLHLNGYVTSSLVTQNITYGNEIEGITFQSGVNTTTVSSNLSFNNSGAAFSIYSYKPTGSFTFAGSGCDSGPYNVSTASWSAGTATVTFTASHQMTTGLNVFISGITATGGSGGSYNCPGVGCTITAVTGTAVSFLVASDPGTYSSGGVAEIGAGDQANNLIENNTFYQGNTDPGNGAIGPGQNSAVVVESCDNNFSLTTCPTVSGDLGSNTFRNNVIVNYGDCASSPCAPNAARREAPVFYLNTPTSVGPANYLATSTWDHNLFWQSDGTNGSVAAFGWGLAGNGTNTCTGSCNGNIVYSQTGVALNGGAAFPGGVASNNIQGDPQMANVSPTYYNQPGQWDMRLLPSSLALHAGSVTSLPTYDNRGRAFVSATPSMGGLERQLYNTTGWNDIPNTKITNTALGGAANVCPTNGFGGSVCPSPNGVVGGCSTHGTPYPYQTQCHGVIDAWNSAIFQTSTSSLWIWGGGHTDYGGNEVYRVQLNSISPQMQRVKDPSPIADVSLGVGVSAMPDGNPSSRHTFGQLAYWPDSEKMIAWNGSLFSGNGTALCDLWSLDLNTLTWSALTPTGATLGCGASTGALVWNPVAKNFFMYTTSAASFTYDPQANIAASLGSGSGGGPYPYAVVDTRRNWVYQFGCITAGIPGCSSGTSGYVMRSKAPATTPMDFTSLTPNGAGGAGSKIDSSCLAAVNADAPGVQYDYVNDRFVFYPQDSLGTVYFMTRDDATDIYSCISRTLSGGPPSTGNLAPLDGTYGRFRYDPNQDVLFALNGFNQDVFALNLNAPDPTGSTAVSNGTSLSGAVSISGKAVIR